MHHIRYNRNLKHWSQNLRNKSTFSEVLLWNKIKKAKVDGLHFLRQKPLNNFIVDFYCKEIKLALEVDGSSHDNKQEYDAYRQAKLESYGITFLRFRNEEVKNDIDTVVWKIKSTARGLREGG